MASYGTTRRHHQHAVLPQLGQLVLGLSLAVDTSEVANSRDHADQLAALKPQHVGSGGTVRAGEGSACARGYGGRERPRGREGWTGSEPPVQGVVFVVMLLEGLIPQR